MCDETGNKIAFSVWFKHHENDEPPKYLQEIRERSVDVVGKAYSDIRLITEGIVDDTHQKMHDLRDKYPNNIRYFTKISDYLRVYYIHKWLMEGAEEVYYFDYDLVILRPPTGWGVALGAAFECDDKIGENVVKWWNRLATNSSYRLNQSHLPIIEEHLKALQDGINRTDGFPKHCYPMNHMSMFDDIHLYIDNCWILGELWRPDWYTLENTLDICRAIHAITGIKSTGVDSFNLFGSQPNDDIDPQIEEIIKLDNAIKTIDYSDAEALSRVKARLIGARLRPNYNSPKMRQAMKRFLNDRNPVRI